MQAVRNHVNVGAIGANLISRALRVAVAADLSPLHLPVQCSLVRFEFQIPYLKVDRLSFQSRKRKWAVAAVGRSSYNTTVATGQPNSAVKNQENAAPENGQI